jgi:membrane protease YdiL (CAAX protease family)
MKDENLRGGPELEPGAGEDQTSESLFEAVGAGTLLLLVVACLFLYFFFQGILWSGEPGSDLWGLSLSPILGILLPVALFVRSRQRSFRDELWLYGLAPRQVLGVVLAMAGTIPLAYAVATLNEAIVPADPTYRESLQSLVPHDRASLVAGFLGIVVMAPLGEEILFRGLLLGTLGRSLRAMTAIVVTGIFFGLTHLVPWLVLPISILGIVLGILVWLTRTLTAAWIAHALFNLAGYWELASTGNVETPKLMQLSLHPAMLVLVPLFLGGAWGLLRPVGGESTPPPPDVGGKVEE